MTNSFPPEPQTSPEEERVRQRIRAKIRQETRDEWIAILVAFGTIGTILLWSLGLRSNSVSTQWNKNFATSRIEKEDKPVTRSSSSRKDSNVSVAPIVTTPKPSKPKNNQNFGFDSNQNNNQRKVRTSLNNTSRAITRSKPSGIKAPIAITPPKPKPRVEPKAKPPEVKPEPKATTPEVKPKAEPKAVVSFDDVTNKHWAYPFLQELGKQKLVGATSDNNFEPDAPITRAGMATLISQAFDQPKVKQIKKFDDIDTNSAISQDIDKSVGIGFMKGYSDTEFRPSEKIPRYQVMVALATGLGLEPAGDPVNTLQGFSDRRGVPKWAISQVAAATESGLAVNRPKFGLDSLKPTQPATRAEVAAMIYQALKQQGKVKEIDSAYIIPKP